MTLEDQIKQLITNFDNTTSDHFLEILEQIKPFFKNSLISEYLQGKIQKITDTADEVEKQQQCKALLPYLGWYLQGL